MGKIEIHTCKKPSGNTWFGLVQGCQRKLGIFNWIPVWIVRGLINRTKRTMCFVNFWFHRDFVLRVYRSPHFFYENHEQQVRKITQNGKTPFTFFFWDLQLSFSYMLIVDQTPSRETKFDFCLPRFKPSPYACASRLAKSIGKQNMSHHSGIAMQAEWWYVQTPRLENLPDTGGLLSNDLCCVRIFSLLCV